MLQALTETILSWSGRQRRVLVIHDEQSALTADRLTRLQQVLANDGGPSPADADEARALPAGVSPLAELVMADSRNDPRVQVAELLARVAGGYRGSSTTPTTAFPLPDLAARSRRMTRDRQWDQPADGPVTVGTNIALNAKVRSWLERQRGEAAYRAPCRSVRRERGEIGSEDAE
jgi:hypothetical protein